MFTAFGVVVAWGGGFNPAVQALALELYAKRNREAAAAQGGEGAEERRGKKGREEKEGREAETGRLFGAMSVIQAMWYVHPHPPSRASLEILK